MRWPKPMSRSPRASFARMKGSAFDASPISKTISRAGPGAPPWSGPFNAPIAPPTAEMTSDSVETMTRAAKVDALRPWSMTVLKYVSSARALASLGRVPESM